VRAVRTTNLALKFLLELAAFGGLAVLGATVSWILALVAPLVAIAIWGRWCAPKSSHRLPASRRVPLELAVFAGGGVGWFVGADTWMGVVYAVLVVVNAALLAAFDDWDV
jgi:hypothetical protein